MLKSQKKLVANNLQNYVFLLFFVCILILSISKFAHSAIINKNGKDYYTENKRFIILKVSKNLNAYINKKNQKVYYRYNKIFYFWNKGIWFDAKKLNGMFKIVPQNSIPGPLKHGPLLRVKKKKIPAGFAAMKVPPKAVKHGLPNAATQHLYNLPLTLHGLVIYQKNFDFNGIEK